MSPDESHRTLAIILLFWRINHFIFKLVMFTMVIESRNFDIALSHWNIKELLHPDSLAKF